MRSDVTNKELLTIRDEMVAFAVNERLIKGGGDIDFTCDYCPDAATCEFAFDVYNTYDDCLKLK